MKPRSSAAPSGAWQRRARPLLGTLVEVGVWRTRPDDDWPANAAFASIAEVQAGLSRFDPASDIGCFNALGATESIEVGPHTMAVLNAASMLHERTGGLFDVSLGSAASGWSLRGRRLHKLHRGCRLDLGGIAKGYAVDCAVRTLRAHGLRDGWVNAGGDLRAFGSARLALNLRDERLGGVRAFGHLADGAFATSCYDAHSRSRLAAPPGHPVAHRHVSVVAPMCLWADALTKLVALRGDTADPLLARFGARAWLH